MGLSKYQSRWSWRYHLSNKIDEVTLLLLILLPSGSIDFTGLSMKGNKSNKKAVENKENYIDGGNFKARIGNTTYLVGVFFNKAKKVTVEDRVTNLICQEVVAGNF